MKKGKSCALVFKGSWDLLILQRETLFFQQKQNRKKNKGKVVVNHISIEHEMNLWIIDFVMAMWNKQTKGCKFST